MANVNMKKMKRDRKKADARSGGGLLKLNEGTTLLYVCPPVHEEDPLPYVEVRNCFGFGPNSRSILDASSLEDSTPFREALEAEGIDYDDARDGWEYAAQYEDFRNRWYFNVIPVAFKRGPGDEYETLPPVVLKFGVGKQIYDGITDAFFEEGDITDPDAAIFVKVTRKGTGLATEYKVRIDTTTLKEPAEIDEEMWKQVEKNCVPGGQNDVHVWLAKQIRTYEQVVATQAGEDEEAEVERRPAKTTARPVSKRKRKRGSGKRKRRREKPEVEESEVEDELDEKSEVEDELDEESDAEFDDEDDFEDDEDVVEEDDLDGDDVDALEAALKARAKKRKRA